MTLQLPNQLAQLIWPNLALVGQIGFPVKQATPKDIIGCEISFSLFLLIRASTLAQPVKSNLNEKLDHKEKTIQAFNIDA